MEGGREGSRVRAVSNVVAAMVLIGVTLAGFAVAYPLFFAEARGVAGAGSVMEREARDSGVRLLLADYAVTPTSNNPKELEGELEVRLWVYNAGWAMVHVSRVIVPGYAEEIVDAVVGPGGVAMISVTVPGNNVPGHVVVVADTGVYVFDLG